LKFSPTDLYKYSKEKDIEIIGVKLQVNSIIVYIITIYRSPSGNFNYFLQILDKILQYINSHNVHITICGDINVNYLIENNQRRKLDNMLLIHNLTSVITFPTRIADASALAVDNIFLDTSRYEDYFVYPLKNNLSDHDGQIVKVKIEFQTITETINIVRKINKYAITDFLYKLSNESWESTFNNYNVDIMFNTFLNTYLRIFNSSFPNIKHNYKKNKNLDYPRY
jgi:hypothetical protein